MPMNSNPTGTDDDTRGFAGAAAAFAAELDSEEEKPTRRGRQEPDPEPEEDEEEGTELVDEDDDEGEDTEDGDEPEEEAEETDESDDEEESDEEPQDRVFTVKIDGKEKQVTERELVDGYFRQQDYTRKTQALAEERRSLTEEAQAVRAERAKYSQLLGALEQTVLQQTQAEPNWAELRATDPIEYATQWAEWQQKQARLQAIRQEQSIAAQRQQYEDAVAQQQHLQAQAAVLLDAIPEWRDPKVARAEKARLKDYGINALGFSEQEMSEVTDARAVMALRKAMRYDEMVRRKGSIKPKAPPPERQAPVLKPGTTVTKSARKQSELKRAQQAHRKAGSIQSAASLFEKLL